MTRLDGSLSVKTYTRMLATKICARLHTIIYTAATCASRVTLNRKEPTCSDAGSGPIQYPEYLEYSRSYQYRVCVDLSQTAIKEARKRIGEHGLYVVADVANLPFKPGCFDAAISLHTIHHLPEGEHLKAYQELYRVMAEQASAVVVNGWPSSPLMRIADPLIRLGNRMRNRLGHEKGEPALPPEIKKVEGNPAQNGGEPAQAKGTFTNRHDVAWIKTRVGSQMPVEILVWRSLSVRFMRSLIHPRLLGRQWLSVIYWLEERFPHFFGENGQYPLIVIRKGSV